MRRLAAAEPADRVAMDRVVDELLAELHRRLGGPFTVQELADLYVEEGTDWCSRRRRPGGADPAGGVGPADRRRGGVRSLRREAGDYATGRRAAESEPPGLRAD